MNRIEITSIAPPFRGYFRQSKREAWSELASAESYSDCWEALLTVLAQSHRRGGDSMVCQTDPNKLERRSRRSFQTPIGIQK